MQSNCAIAPTLQKGLCRRLIDRELGGRKRRRTTQTLDHAFAERIKNLTLSLAHDTHNPDIQSLKFSYLRRRSKIVEIVCAGDLYFALTLSGVCAAFLKGKFLTLLNTKPDEVIRSIFYNKVNSSIISVSVFMEDNFASLKCRSTPLQYVCRCKSDLGFDIFERISLKWPGFVELDDVNGKILTYSAEARSYCVWDMKNYDPLYKIPDSSVNEIKISPDLLLLSMERKSGYVPLKILSIQDGRVIRTLSMPVHRTKKIDFIEQFNEKLLIKQDSECLLIMDVLSSSVIRVPETENLTPSAFIFLHEKMLFLTFRSRQICAWNFRGQIVSRFQDHVLSHPDTNTSNIFITSSQDYIISYCKRRDQDNRPGGTVNITHITSGKCVAKIAGGEAMKELQDVTALSYNEALCELYIGASSGMMYTFSL